MERENKATRNKRKKEEMQRIKNVAGSTCIISHERENL